MPNHFIFDQSNSSFYGRLKNSYIEPGIVAPPESNAAANDRSFISSATNSSSLGILGGTVTISLQISNPLGSGRTMYIAGIVGGVNVSLSLLSSFSASVTLYQGGTLSSPSTLTPFNAKFGSAAASSMTARSSTSAPSGATSFMSYAINPGLFEFPFQGSLVIPPNQIFTMNVSASLSVAGVLSTTATVMWWEA
ncbi:hypothetical protein [Paenibacillus kobensis]|uniref:hypothetical protein n=1 Tax=Paenibacillus kobensis TaxID=59841 RepID=UPI000FDAD912|nr:hypothetical protein [Paenibacillus kobensis]